eukprot:gb/GEZN01010058.1/.p1 GENE.gb/GEZN01010058.1/~~gb/GEZN01010058.1/.p1  ORF type:complete len:272 (-),score=48.99 gb/GEZN01010058.1/:286-1101(-)
MAAIVVRNVEVLDNPSRFTNPFQFVIHFLCNTPLKKELEWKLVYVGSADDSKYDQELETVLVGPVSVGQNKFVFQAPAPDPALIPRKDLLDVTVLILSCSYNGEEFLRVGYYVSNEYTDPVFATDPPSPPMISHLRRSILADKPRVTRFNIAWDIANPENDAGEFDYLAERKMSDYAEEQQSDNNSMDEAAMDDSEDEDVDIIGFGGATGRQAASQGGPGTLALRPPASPLRQATPGLNLTSKTQQQYHSYPGAYGPQAGTGGMEMEDPDL